MDQIIKTPTSIIPTKPTFEKKPKMKLSTKKRIYTILSVVLIAISLIAVLFFFLVFVPAKKIMAQISNIQKSIPVIQQAINDKDLNKVKETLATLQTQTTSLEKSYKNLGYLKNMPFVSSYYKDGTQFLTVVDQGIETGNILIKAIEPYKDFLGVKGGSTSGEKTTEDRITFLTQSVEGLLPYLNQIEKNIATMETAINQIDASRYPESFRGYQVRSNITKLQEDIGQVHTAVKNDQPILSKISWLLGKDSPRQFLLIFQNNAELRPTGGFWTAYGLIKVDNGKITPLASDDIYSLDAKINSKIPAPRPILAYHINVPYYNVRDMNISPDFPTSIKLFLDNYQKVNPKNQVDAVISIDLDVLVDMVKVLGQVGVGGFGNFSAEPDSRCNGCPQIIYQLEQLADQPKDHIDNNRKGFLSPLMNSLLSNAMGSEKSKIGPLAQAMLQDINQKHIMFYFSDDSMEQAAKLANIAGTITQTDANTDYMHLNDANMASAKSNLFITQKITHEITTKNGVITHKISVTYTNPAAASNCNLEKGGLCLNAANYRDWFRFYVPTGSKLIKMTGSEVETVQYEELGKQVFEGFYGNKYPLHALGSSLVTVQYTSSVKASKNYTLLLQKEAGTKSIPYQIIVNGQKQEPFDWVADKTIKLSL
jgi:hypothetical protein